MSATTVFTTLTHVECASCGVVFGMTADFTQRRRDDHKTFHCPNGHHQYFYGETEAERLKRELQVERDRVAREKHGREQAEARVRDARLETEHIERRLRGTKSVVTRMKRRAAAGRCPCCSHQFKDLERHMKHQHPKWNPDRAAEALSEKQTHG
jgi:hypothetical protein